MFKFITHKKGHIVIKVRNLKTKFIVWVMRPDSRGVYRFRRP